jgi:archaellum biogenesis ATPase FlaH
MPYKHTFNDINELSLELDKCINLLSSLRQEINECLIAKNLSIVNLNIRSYSCNNENKSTCLSGIFLSSNKVLGKNN